MTVSVLLAIVLRYVLKVPNIAGEEISRYLLVTIVFIGISMCVRTRSHMGVTIFSGHAARVPAPGWSWSSRTSSRP